MPTTPKRLHHCVFSLCACSIPYKALYHSRVTLISPSPFRGSHLVHTHTSPIDLLCEVCYVVCVFCGVPWPYCNFYHKTLSQRTCTVHGMAVITPRPTPQIACLPSDVEKSSFPRLTGFGESCRLSYNFAHKSTYGFQTKNGTSLKLCFPDRDGPVGWQVPELRQGAGRRGEEWAKK